jgi:small GTP-binding protein
MTSIKIVIVGDGDIGKTCLLMSYAFNRFPSESTPTIFDDFDTEVMVDGRKFVLHFHDTAGQSDFDRIRPMGYNKADVVLVCFSLADPVTNENVMNKWIPELDLHLPHVPRILVGTKKDLRDTKKVRGVSHADGCVTATKMGATKFIECSALTQMGVKDVFDTAIHACLAPAKKPTRLQRKKECIIL